MSTQAAESATVLERLGKLEKQNRWLKAVAWISLWLAAITSLAIVAILAGWCPHLGAGQGYFGMVNVRTYPGGLLVRLQDENENSLAFLRNDYGTLKLELFTDVLLCDQSQQTRARLKVDKNGVRLEQVAPPQAVPVAQQPAADEEEKSVRASMRIHFRNDHEAIDRGDKLLRLLRSGSENLAEKVKPFVGTKIAVCGGGGGATANLHARGGWLIRVEIDPPGDPRPEAVMWNAIVLGQLQSIDVAKKTIIIRARKQDWISIETW